MTKSIDDTITCDNIQNVTNKLDLKNILKLLSGALIFIFLGLFIAITIPVYLFRFLVIVLAKIFRPDLDNILNGPSSLLANDYFYNSTSPRASLIISLVIESNNVTVEQLKERLLERWVYAKDTSGKLKFKQFQQYPVRWMGFTFWKNIEDVFDINNHAFEQNYHSNEKSYLGDDDNGVTNICEMLLNKPYSSFNSPWEVHLVNNPKTGNVTKSVVIFKIHHCLADGYSMLSAIVEEFGQHTITSSQIPMPRFPKRSVLEKIIYYISFPFSVLFEFSYVLSHIFHANRWKVPDEKKDWYQVCAKSDLIPIEKVKFIKTQLEVTFTSVLLSAISSGIDSTFQSLESDENKNGKNDSSMFCLSTLPLPGHPKGLTNYFTAALFDLPIVKFNNSVERLKHTNCMLEMCKNTCIPIIIPLYFSIMGCHFYPVGKFFGKMRMTPIGLSNFPCVPIQIEENGIKYVSGDFMAGGLDGSVGVLISIISYNGNIRVTVTAEKAVMSKEEVKTFVNYVTSEIDRLYEIASVKENGNVLDVKTRSHFIHTT